ncbi:MAG: hypothetical protein ACRC56_02205, partial [Bosea sp. (in: a-proteobacteria)]
MRLRNVVLDLAKNFTLSIPHGHRKVATIAARHQCRATLFGFEIEVFMTLTCPPRFAAALLAASLLSATSLSPFAALQPIPAAVAQAAVTIENVNYSIEAAKMALRIPKMTFEGSTATKADIDAIFASGPAETLHERLAKVSARSVSIPLIELQYTVEGETTVTEYRDTIVRGLRNGVAEEWLTPVQTTRTISDGKSKAQLPMTVKAENMVLKGVDMPLMVRFLFDKAAPGEGLKSIMTEQRIGLMTYDLGSKGSFTIASITAGEFKVKPLATPAMALFTKLKPAVGEADEKAVLSLVSSIFSSMSFAPMRMTGMKGEIRTDEKAKPATFAMDEMMMSGGVEHSGDFQMRNLSVVASTGSFKLGEFAITGVNMSKLWKDLETMAAQGKSLADFDPASISASVDRIRLSGLDMDLPDTKDAKQRVKGKLGLFDMKMSNTIGVIPANIEMALENFAFDLPRDSREDSVKQLLAMG